MSNEEIKKLAGEILPAFQRAVLMRSKTWDAERDMETVLGHDMHGDLEGYPVAMNASTLAEAQRVITLETAIEFVTEQQAEETRGR